MWIAALFGMATKYSEGLLAVKYRKIDEDGHVLGGPFYYIESGMGHKWRWLAKIFAFFGACVGLMGIGTFTQVNGIASAVQAFFDPDKANTVSILGNDYSIAIVITAFILAILVGLVVIGGIQRISKVSQGIVPFMAVLYIVVCLVLIIVNINKVPAAFATIVKCAFKPMSFAGGVTASLAIAMQKGVARGIFSNEAGLGSAPIAAAAAQTKEPVRQGLVTMTGTFIDTIIVCTLTGLSIVMMDSYKVVGLEGTMTGLSIVMMGSWQDGSLEGIAVTTDAFQKGLFFMPGQVAAFILMICLVFFAFTTILGWDYYGERCLEYLTNGSKVSVQIYRWLYILCVFIGPYMTVKAVWTIADIFNGLMAIPNIIALLALSSVVVAETKDYFARHKEL